MTQHGPLASSATVLVFIILPRVVSFKECVTFANLIRSSVERLITYYASNSLTDTSFHQVCYVNAKLRLKPGYVRRKYRDVWKELSGCIVITSILPKHWGIIVVENVVLGQCFQSTWTCQAGTHHVSIARRLKAMPSTSNIMSFMPVKKSWSPSDLHQPVSKKHLGNVIPSSSPPRRLPIKKPNLMSDAQVFSYCVCPTIRSRFTNHSKNKFIFRCWRIPLKHQFSMLF